MTALRRLAWLCLLPLSNCAFAPRWVELRPPPVPALPTAARPVCIQLQPVRDARTDPQWIGVVRNGLYLPTAHAESHDSPADWVGHYLQRALAQAGAAACEPPPTAALTLTCELRDAFVDEYWNLDARIALHVHLDRGGATLLDADFVGTHRRTSSLGSADEFSETLSAALTDLLEKAMPPVLTAAGERAGP